MTLNKSALPKIDNLISLATREIDKHNLDDSYLGTEQDVKTSNSFFNKIGSLLKIDLAEDDEWGTYLLKATSQEAYEYAIKQLKEIRAKSTE